jgi:hypothetical protein
MLSVDKGFGDLILSSQNSGLANLGMLLCFVAFARLEMFIFCLCKKRTKKAHPAHAFCAF